MSDQIRRLSDELARDPSSLVFLQLGESLRTSGQLDVALRVSLRGLERHAYSAEAHDLLARICVDRGELQRALDEWDMVLRLAPEHSGARKGMGFVLYKQGRFSEAERYLREVAASDAGDVSIAHALASVERLQRPDVPQPELATPSRHDARRLFADILGDGDQTALLIDSTGLVLAGAYVAADGREVAHEIGAALSGVREEAERAMRHLPLGAWTSISFEAEAATVAMAPAPNGALVMVAADPALPLGFVRRVLESCVARARVWLTEGK
ncbi:MAG: tetratricopeptide repeat protein [Gemmatimonadaceae bacterium]|nr:tetratricopeptide repeat protein [Gemmatimonadaceae bacterium]MDQ3517745.1 tetratricopeptide repeat protein [Gemmatimonadota bacterium]